jgi:alkaline phosphatase D
MLLLASAHGCASPAPRASASTAPVKAVPRVPRPFRLAFGSCNDVKRPQLLWGLIAALKPDVWVWLGDNVYADTEDMTLMRLLYAQLRAEPGYAQLRAQTRVIGTWDDHDYGRNNAGREYPMRAEAQQALLDFLDEPADSPRRRQQGVYASYDFGTPPQQVRVILLDTRYHRDRPSPEGDVLGAQQWSWLEQQLRGSPATVHLIGSSVQVIADEHRFEKWANFPRARARLLRLVVASGARNVFFLSGDRHFAELARLALAPGGPWLHELTSSSLARPWKDASELNSHRIGELYRGVNFGFVQIDWSAAPPSVLLEVHDQHGAVPIAARVPLAAATSARAAR